MKSYLEQALEQAEQKIENGDFRKGLSKLEDACWNVTAADNVEAFDRIRALAERVVERTDGGLAKKAGALVDLTEERRAAYVEGLVPKTAILPAPRDLGDNMTGSPARRLFALSVASIVFASLVAIFVWLQLHGSPLSFCSSQRFGGANIDHGLVVALLAGLGGAIAILVVRRRRRILAAVLLLEAVSLSVAIALVALDSATYQTTDSCLSLLSDNYTATSTSVSHVEYLYGLWGVPVALILWATVAPWLKPRLFGRDN